MRQNGAPMAKDRLPAKQQRPELYHVRTRHGGGNGCRRGNTTILSKAIDRPFTNLRWSKDGKLIYALTEDDRESNIVSFDAANGTYAKVTQGSAPPMHWK